MTVATEPYDGELCKLDRAEGSVGRGDSSCPVSMHKISGCSSMAVVAVCVQSEAIKSITKGTGACTSI